MTFEQNIPGHVPGNFYVPDVSEYVPNKLVPFFPFRVIRDDDVWVIKNPLTGKESELNDAACSLLKYCDGYRTFDEIVMEISNSYKTDNFTVLDMSLPILEKLTGEGLIWWRRERLNYWKLPPPAGVLWDITSRCNLHCKHCVVSAGEMQRNELNFAECCRLIDEFADFGVRQLILSGGEPMVREDFFDIAEYAAGKGIFIQVATNGTLIDRIAAQRLADIGACAQVSLDSADPAVHDEFRQCFGSWHKTKEGIELLIKSGVPVTLAATVTTLNIDGIPELYELAKDMGVTTFRILPFVPLGRGKYADELEVTPVRMRELTRILLSKREELCLNIAPMEFECTFRPSAEEGIDASTRIGCDGAISYCTVTSNGEVLPCNYFSGAEVENVKEKDFRWIWYNSHFLNYFRSLKASDIRGVCQQCAWLPVCRGSCLAANFAHGDLFQSNCHCWLVNPSGAYHG